VESPILKPVNECTSTVSAIKSEPGIIQDAIIEITMPENISTKEVVKFRYIYRFK
jgi:hypothetical protein